MTDTVGDLSVSFWRAAAQKPSAAERAARAAFRNNEEERRLHARIAEWIAEGGPGDEPSFGVADALYSLDSDSVLADTVYRRIAAEDRAPFWRLL